MSQVNTIRGPIDSAALGRTLSHEHLTNGSGGMEHIPGLMDTPVRRQEIVDRCVEALARVRQSGIESVIDLTPFDLGRQMWLFQAVAARHAEHGVNIVCATGVYRWPASATTALRPPSGAGGTRSAVPMSGRWCRSTRSPGSAPTASPTRTSTRC